MTEIDPVASAVDALVQRATAMAETIGARPGHPGGITDQTLLLMALRKVLVARADALEAEPRRKRYAQRICVEYGHDPDTLVWIEPIPVVTLMDRHYQHAPTTHLPQWGPLWLRIYGTLPSLGGIENETETELHNFQPWSGRCQKCDATREDLLDNLVDKFSCPGPCTEVRLFTKTKNWETWQKPNGQRYIREVPGDEKSEFCFNEWKAGG
jgi:hypothetical protein